MLNTKLIKVLNSAIKNSTNLWKTHERISINVTAADQVLPLNNFIWNFQNLAKLSSILLNHVKFQMH